MPSEPAETPPSNGARSPRPAPSLGSRVLGALASLRLTVALFALAIFLVFVGTLAQVDHDIWYVVDHTYFRVWFAWVEWQALVRFAEMFTKGEPQPVAGGFWFPGGMLIGAAMGLNLLAAHSVRFKVAARGAKLSAGLGVIALGAAATAWVVIDGMDNAMAGDLSPRFCEGLWQTLRASLAGLSLAGAYWAVQSYGKVRPAEWWLALAVDAAMLLVAGWLFANPDTRIDDAGLRILWQLAKGGAAAALLLYGCVLVFKQRAGVVLLHAGILLLMFGELLTGLTAEEAQMRIEEGQTVNYAYDIRETELAVMIPQADGSRRVTVVPDSMLARAAQAGSTISHHELPFDLRVERFDVNSSLAQPDPQKANPATAGAGLERVAVPLRSVVGVGAETGVNLPSAYLELLDKASGESLGVWLVSASYLPTGGGGGLSLREQPVAVGDGAALLELRMQRDYKPYSLTLTDFRFDRYVGTNTPKNYSSDVVLRDPTRGVERNVRIWMNNPLRYDGDTLYQSGFDEATERATILQVATNGGWMIPYVSCMLVGVGMLAHFAVTLTRFARRRAEEAARLAKKTTGASPEASWRGLLTLAAWRKPAVWAPALATVLCAGYLAGKARVDEGANVGFAIERFGKLPVAEGGRIKPIDTLARNTLQFLSARQEVLPIDKGAARQPATEWLLGVVSGRESSRQQRVFRVENLEVLDVLGLPPRLGSYRYSYDEVVKSDKLKPQVDRVQERLRAGEKLSLVQTKTKELADKLEAFQLLVGAFGSPQMGFDPETIEQEVRVARERSDLLGRLGAPRATPPVEAAGEWKTLYEAELEDLFFRATKKPTNPATAALSRAVDAYAQDDVEAFNGAVDRMEQAVVAYEETLDQSLDAGSAASVGLASAERLSTEKVGFEHFFNAFSPFYYCAVTYLIAFVLTACGWLGWARPLGRSATAVIAVTLLVHTFALVARVYISGRPPVTNLYSSAVFIGWAAALFGLAFEAIYKLGVGNAVASAIGFATLVVAHYLSLDGDTFTVLQAVLDTQFWLATHVVCITLGYSTTFLAGFLGLAYLVGGHALNHFGDKGRQQLTRMTYGALCFALFFSFIGTVLGGLWADDSWGRFWGWDPKENGALIIVLWNALVLHARWGKLVGPTGLAALAVGGNIVTTWSWFGVNELGVGLHSYGFTDGVSFWLLAFAVSQLAVASLAVLPKRAAAAS